LTQTTGFTPPVGQSHEVAQVTGAGVHCPLRQTSPHAQRLASFPVHEVELRGMHFPHPFWSQIGRSGGQLQLSMHGSVHWFSGDRMQLHHPPHAPRAITPPVHELYQPSSFVPTFRHSAVHFAQRSHWMSPPPSQAPYHPSDFVPILSQTGWQPPSHVHHGTLE
jgi:hypothetical protein